MLLPGAANRLLDAGPAGWTSTAQVTATGCTPARCPRLDAEWARSTSGVGRLRGTLMATSGHAGVASATWRSVRFVAPASIGEALWTLSLADHRRVASPSIGSPSTYTVRILDETSGGARTIVDRAPVPAAEELLPAPPLTLPAGTLEPGHLYRLELATQLSFGTSAGDGAVELALPTLAVSPAPSDPASPADLPVPPVPGLPERGASEPPAGQGGSEAAGSAEPPPSEGPSPSADAPVVGPRRQCLHEDRDVAVLGAGLARRRITVAGQADVPSGTQLELRSSDGWSLGRVRVGADGRFAATVAEPRGSAGVTRVLARSADGRGSSEVRVARRNVLTGASASGGKLIVDGLLDPRLARAARLTAVVDHSVADPCTLTGHARPPRVEMDRRTGRYRLTVRMPESPASTGADARTPRLVRVRITAARAGRKAVSETSQVIFGAGSDRRGT